MNTKLKHFLMIALVHLSLASAMAAPARPKAITVSQPDGSKLTMYARGDEYAHWLQATDGVLLMQGDDGAYYYAVKDAEGILANSGILAHNPEERTLTESLFIEGNTAASLQGLDNIIQASKPKRMLGRQTDNLTRAAGKINNIRGKHVQGKMNVLVILVEFADKAFTVDKPLELFDDQYNKEGFNKYGHIGSVRDYFYDQSYGQLDLSFDVVGPVKVSRDVAYYGKNNAYGNDSHPGQMVCEACKLVESSVDFSKYDNDGDGYVDQVYVIYAGYDEAESGVSNYLWGHQFDLYSRKLYYSDGDGILTFDGVKVKKYACSSELAGSEGNMLEPIGTFCHEFSHCLGLMDAYDVNYNGGFGMQALDLMDGGMYNGPYSGGEVPCGYTAYERWYLGWLDLVELDSPASIINMPSLGEQPVAYVMHNDKTPTEFFTVENRQNDRWFSYVLNSDACHGMLITHIDYAVKSWTSNSINTVKSHQRMSYVPADNNFGILATYEGRKYYNISEDNYRGDFFPGLYNVTEFTDDSHLSSGGKLFNVNTDGTRKLGKPITNIREIDGLISFDFKGGDSNNVIDAVADVSASCKVEEVIYDVSGNKVKSMSCPGIYVVKSAGVARKVLVE